LPTTVEPRRNKTNWCILCSFESWKEDIGGQGAGFYELDFEDVLPIKQSSAKSFLLALLNNFQLMI
jgi:hypothetical protein